MAELPKAEQIRRRKANQAARSRPRCAETEHEWKQQGDEFSLASGDRCTTWQCTACAETRFVYRDREEP